MNLKAKLETILKMIPKTALKLNIKPILKMILKMNLKMILKLNLKTTLKKKLERCILLRPYLFKSGFLKVDTLIERYSVSHVSIQMVTFALRFQRSTEKKINSQELVGQKRLERRSLNAKVFSRVLILGKVVGTERDLEIDGLAKRVQKVCPNQQAHV